MTATRINGMALETAARGSGPTVVLVHGSVSDLRTWRGAQQALADRFRTVAYSRRYHWPNEPIPPGADYSMREHVDDLREVVCAQGGEPVHLIGHSYGAFLCLLLAIREPRLVRSMVLAEPPAVTLFVSVPPTPAELLGLLLRRPRTGAAIMRFAATGWGPAQAAAERDDMDQALAVFGPATLGRAAYEALSAERRQQVHDNLIRAEFVGSGFAPLAEADVRRVTTPTLLVRGEHSPPMFGRVTAHLDKLLPDSAQVTLADASHITHEDNPAAYVAAVSGFMARH